MPNPKIRSGTPLILAMDIGTSSFRSALFNVTAHRISKTTAQQSYRLHTTGDGGAELSPGRLKQAALSCLKQTLYAYRKNSALRSRPIVAVGVSCFWHSLMGLDQNGKITTPIYTWADSRSCNAAVQLRETFSEKTIHARTGCMLRSSFWPAKLRWLRQKDPSLFRRVKRWMSPGEWLQQEFSGLTSCSYSMASGTGLLNSHRLTWDKPLLSHCHIQSDSLNPIQDTPWLSSKTLWKELQEAQWFPSIGDGAANNLGSGAMAPGFAALNIGTSAALRFIFQGNRVKAPFGLFCYRVDEKRYLIGGAISNAGNLRRWCLDQLRLPKNPRAIEKALASRITAQHGLAVLPFWTAERAPTWPENLKGTIMGITQATTALDLLQAMTEASYLRLASISEIMIPQIHGPLRILVSGGIHQSPASLQRLAHILNQKLYVTQEHEASLRGAAVFVLEKLGFQVPAPKITSVFKPDPKMARHDRQTRFLHQKLEKHFIAF